MKNNACRLSVIIISILLVLCGSTLGSTLTSEALGFTPGSEEFASWDTGPYLGLRSGSEESLSGQLGLARDKTLVFGRLGMASVSSTSISEQVDLAAGPSFGAEIFTPEQTPTIPTSSSVSHPMLKDHDPVLRHRVSDKNFLAPSLRPTLLLGSIFQPATIIIP